MEITGIPQYIRDRDIPWCSPDFVPRPSTRSSAITFEVSIFESNMADFILPNDLFYWRLKNLESEILKKGDPEGIEVTDFLSLPDEKDCGEEDGKYDTFSCSVLCTIENFEQELHFQNSGYNALHIRYDTSDEGNVCPWDVSIRGQENDAPLPPSLSSDQKIAISSILDEIENDEYVYSVFSAPVDTRVFADYMQMIEVPMNISFIRRRLNQNYYTSILSIESDMKLIRDNCLKYNRQGSDITKEAVKLYENFCKAVREKMTVIGFETVQRTVKNPNRDDVVSGFMNQSSQPVTETRRLSRSIPADSGVSGHSDESISLEQTSNITSHRITRAKRRSLESDDESCDESSSSFSDHDKSSRKGKKSRNPNSKVILNEDDDEEYASYHQSSDYDSEDQRKPPSNKRSTRSTKTNSLVEEVQQVTNSSSRITRSSETSKNTARDYISSTPKVKKTSKKRTIMSPSSQLETLPVPSTRKRSSNQALNVGARAEAAPTEKSSENTTIRRRSQQVNYGELSSSDVDEEDISSRKMKSKEKLKKSSKENVSQTSSIRVVSRRSTTVEYNHSILSDAASQESGIEPAPKRTKKTDKMTVPTKKPSHKTRNSSFPVLIKWPSNSVKPDQLKQVCSEIIERVVSESLMFVSLMLCDKTYLPFFN